MRQIASQSETESLVLMASSSERLNKESGQGKARRGVESRDKTTASHAGVLYSLCQQSVYLSIRALLHAASTHPLDHTPHGVVEEEVSISNTITSNPTTLYCQSVKRYAWLLFPLSPTHIGVMSCQNQIIYPKLDSFK